MTSATPASDATQNQGSTPSGGGSSSSLFAIGPDDVIFSVQYINDGSWPDNLKLCLDDANWDEWSFQVSLFADKQGFTDYLNGTLSCPDKSKHSKAFQIWTKNDRSFRAFLLTYISRDDCRRVTSCTTSHSVFEELRKIHEKQGPHAKMLLIHKAM